MTQRQTRTMPKFLLMRSGRALLAASALLALTTTPAGAEVSESRVTPIVRVVQSVGPSVVNIQGQKTIVDTAGGADASRQVNGMGTGVIIDPRGYILTNFHVVDGVRQINVTLADRRSYTAKLIANDPQTDLAVIKVHSNGSLPTIPIGTSSDLMTGEQVIAVGNAFGYENTVTRGIISALHRDVQVSETQAYDDLIQTDASINPGNSGGPLLGIEGKMIGVNVAVRAGAQGIGFAIPVDKAMEVAAAIMAIERVDGKSHGMDLTSNIATQSAVVRYVASGGAADQAGLASGDVITSVAGRPARRALDVELALLGRPAGVGVPVEFERAGRVASAELKLQPRGRSRQPASVVASTRDPQVWEMLGLALEQEPAQSFERIRSPYRGGMRVVEVRPGGPAASQGIRAGDILVGMHRWETATTQDIRYIVTRANLPKLGNVKFLIIRGDETLFGHIAFADQGTAVR